MPVGLEEAEHVGVLGVFEVHETPPARARVLLSHWKLPLPDGEALGRDCRPGRGPSFAVELSPTVGRVLGCRVGDRLGSPVRVYGSRWSLVLEAWARGRTTRRSMLTCGGRVQAQVMVSATSSAVRG